MRIQVDCRNVRGATEPRSFLLGTQRLWVLRVLERSEEPGLRRFTVMADGGRRFMLRHDTASGDWFLEAILAPVVSEKRAGLDRHQRGRRGVP